MAKPRDFKAEYKRRLASAVARGKSVQEARGHRAGESARRAIREREKSAAATGGVGLSGAEERTIRTFVRRTLDPQRYKGIDADDLVEFYGERGFEAFRNYRGVWWRARREYLQRAKRDPGLKGGKGRKARREASGGGEGGSQDDYSDGWQYLDDISGQADIDDATWLYYH
jgi:hypothetical protein